MQLLSSPISTYLHIKAVQSASTLIWDHEKFISFLMGWSLLFKMCHKFPERVRQISIHLSFEELYESEQFLARSRWKHKDNNHISASMRKSIFFYNSTRNFLICIIFNKITLRFLCRNMTDAVTHEIVRTLVVKCFSECIMYFTAFWNIISIITCKKYTI